MEGYSSVGRASRYHEKNTTVDKDYGNPASEDFSTLLKYPPCDPFGWRIFLIFSGELAQLVERVVRNDEVRGSIPLLSISLPSTSQTAGCGRIKPVPPGPRSFSRLQSGTLAMHGPRDSPPTGSLASLTMPITSKISPKENQNVRRTLPDLWPLAASARAAWMSLMGKVW